MHYAVMPPAATLHQHQPPCLSTNNTKHALIHTGVAGGAGAAAVMGTPCIASQHTHGDTSGGSPLAMRAAHGSAGLFVGGGVVPEPAGTQTC